MEWIRAKENPPDVENFGRKAILIAVKGHEKYGDLVWPALCSRVDAGGNKYYHYYLMTFDEVTGYINRRYVTRWAPFPGLPEGD